MKTSRKSALVSAALCLAASLAHSQTDSALSFYPLQIGDRWEYRSSTYGGMGGLSIPLHYYFISVTGDTVLSNGRKYFIVQSTERTEVHPNFQRIDSITSQVFAVDTASDPQEYVIDSLLAPGHSAFAGCLLRGLGGTFVETSGPANYFGALHPCKYFFTLVIYGPFISYTLAQGLGLTSIQSGYNDLDQSTVSLTSDTLVYAKIGGIDYGTSVLVRPQPDIASGFHLYQNYPNPFNGSTQIQFFMPHDGAAALTLFDPLGRKISVLFHGGAQTGVHTVVLSSESLASGMYFYQFSSGNALITRKLVLTK